MATTDYDTRRITATDTETESLDLLQERRASGAPDSIDADPEAEYELPGFDILDEELTAAVVPVRDDEFRCGACFLIVHHGMHAGTRNGTDICRDCA